jgi:copper homeostasis protein
MMMNEAHNGRICVELCIGSAEGAVIAQQAGADRIELCSALMLGGLTPSAGMICEVKATVDIPFVAMVRPRGGGFMYSNSDFNVMQRDAETALELGADGIVFGILTESGNIDLTRCRRLVELASGKQTVFHRAFDVVPDPTTALEQLIDLGVTRVLTSGQEDSAYNGAARIRELIEQAGGRVEILPGGGVNRFNLDDVIARTGCDQIHIAVSTARLDPSVRARPHVSFGGALKPAEDSYPVADLAAARALLRRLHS